jgi:hypothetical protein
VVEELLHNGEVKEDDKITLVLKGMRKKVLKGILSSKQLLN